MERLLGHLCFVSLVRREVLSIFMWSYALTQAAKQARGPVKLWSSVRQELALWDGLAPLL